MGISKHLIVFIPANAGIQPNQAAGFRDKYGMTNSLEVL